MFSFLHPACPVVEDVDYGAITGIHIGETLSTQIPLIQEKGCSKQLFSPFLQAKVSFGKSHNSELLILR